MGLVYHMGKCCEMAGLGRVKCGICRLGISMRLLDARGDGCIGKVLRDTKRQSKTKESKRHRTNTNFILGTFRRLNSYLFYLSSFPLLVLRNLSMV